jgi:hypothetical protein
VLFFTLETLLAVLPMDLNLFFANRMVPNSEFQMNVKNKNPPKRRENGKQSFANKRKPKTHYFEQISYLKRTILSGLFKLTFHLHLSCLFLSLAVNQQFNYLFVISQMEMF